MEDKEFFNQAYHMSPYGENGVLFTAEYAMLRFKHLNLLPNKQTSYIAIIAAFSDSILTGEPFSHDNMTGVICLSKLAGLDFHKYYKHKDYKRRLHPRDLVFYTYAMGGIYKLLALPFLWIPCIAMIVSCYKKTLAGNRMFPTSGKLLAWLRFSAFNMKITKWLCTKIIKWRFDMDWADMFEIYFGHIEGHPNVKLARKIYK